MRKQSCGCTTNHRYFSTLAWLRLYVAKYRSSKTDNLERFPPFMHTRIIHRLRRERRYHHIRTIISAKVEDILLCDWNFPIKICAIIQLTMGIHSSGDYCHKLAIILNLFSINQQLSESEYHSSSGSQFIPGNMSPESDLLLTLCSWGSKFST